MKFILNTTFDFHFCAFFDVNNQLIDFHFWEQPRKDGIEIWNFLKKHNFQNLELSFLGGISGPGSFSSLRTASAILNMLSFSKNLPVHFVRADFVIEAFLKSKKVSHRFLLNTFGAAVFFRNEGGDLERITLEEAVEKFSNEVLFCEFLPEKKRSCFHQTKNISRKGIEKICLEVLQKTIPQKNFIPDYEFPPVS